MYNNGKLVRSSSKTINKKEQFKDLIVNPDLNVQIGDLIEIAPELILQVDNYSSNYQISISQQISQLFQIKPHTEITLKLISPLEIQADFVELSFKDVYLSRSQMHSLAQVTLQKKCLFVGKKLSQLKVKHIQVKGKDSKYGYVTDSTRFIFRSESAKFMIYIQLSKEMFEFDNDGYLFSEKCIDGFLPDLFEKWKSLQCNHVGDFNNFKSRLFYLAEFILRIRNKNKIRDSNAILIIKAIFTRIFTRLLWILISNQIGI